jgi:hypothetical protein
MVWLLFSLEIWRKMVRIAQFHQWYAFRLRERFDIVPCRDCDVPEGMWW